MNPPNSILVFRNGAIGNTLAAVPAMKRLRLSYPDARLCAVLDPVGVELLTHCPYLDVIVPYDKRGADGGLGGTLRIARTLRAQAPDLAILFKRFFRNGLLARLSGANVRAGFSTDGRAPFLNLTIPYRETSHVADLNLELAQACGANAPVDRLPELFIGEEDRRHADTLLKESGVSKDFVVAHFGGVTSGASHVPLELRVSLLKRLVPERSIVVIGTGAAELADAHELCARVENAANLTGAPLRTTIAMLLRAQAFIGTNSGPMNLAAAAKLPGLALFRKDDRFDVEAVKWRPLFPGLRVLPVPTNAIIVDHARILDDAAEIFREALKL